MRLRPEQLPSHLKRGELAAVYFISGDEPLQKLECIDSIRQAARHNGYEERSVFNVDKAFDWSALHHAGDNLSLFASKRIIELRMGSPKPGKEGGKAIVDFVEADNPDTLLIISADKMDRAAQNNKWVKLLEQTGALIQVWPVNPAQLPGWIQSRLQASNRRITMDAARLVAQRVEGNLLAARQEIDKLLLLINKDTIETTDILTTVADSSRYDVFDMIESAYLGNVDRTLTMLSGLRREGAEPLALFGAFMWDFRRTCSIASESDQGTNLDRLFNTYRIWDQKKRALTAILKRHTCKKLQHLLTYCARIDRTMKSSNKDYAWDQLTLLLLAVAGMQATNKKFLL